MIRESIWTTFDGTHLAGIVPVGSNTKVFQLPYEDCLMPIGENLTMVRMAVLSCAAIGCKTIWVVCNDSTTPMLRQHVGEWVKDPKGEEYHSHFKNYQQRDRYIPIYYVPCNPIDSNRRDSLGYSVLHGAKQASKVSANLSRWILPTKYYVSFPFGIHNFVSMTSRRELAREGDRFTLFTDENGNTVKDGKPLPFIASAKMLNMCRANVHQKSTSMWAQKEWDAKIKKRLPAEEAYSARFFTLAEVFEQLPDMNEESIGWFFDGSSWDGYKAFMESGLKLWKPKGLISPDSTPLNKIGE